MSNFPALTSVRVCKQKRNGSVHGSIENINTEKNGEHLYDYFRGTLVGTVEWACLSKADRKGIGVCVCVYKIIIWDSLYANHFN